MSLFHYFDCEKVKAVGDNNNLEAMKKDDDQSNATGVAKSTGTRKFKKKVSYISRVVED